MPVAAAPLIIGALSAAGAIGGSAISAHAAGKAADQQAQSAQAALDYTKQAEAPYLQLGNTSIGQLMNMPDFTAPTLEDARNTPGYQFTQEQGDLGITRGAAAAGGAFTGGTLKALDKYNSGLADSTYNDVFSRALQGYQTNLQKIITPLTIGANAASGTSTNIANLMTQQGNAQAAGTVGTANAISQGISGVTNAGLQTYLLGQLFPRGQAQPYGTLVQNPSLPMPAIPDIQMSPLQTLPPPG